jgi:arsenite methyltransferase
MSETPHWIPSSYLDMTLFLLIAFLFQVPHQHHPPRDANEYAHVLDDPSREKWQKPHEVVMALNLKPADVVADIGAGTGYFARRFARHAAKVYAVDVEQKLLERAAKDAPANLETVLATHADPKLAPGSVDVIVFVNVLHHIDQRPAYYQKLKAALKPGGRIINIDFFKRDLPVGPPVSMKLTEEEVIAEFKAAGLRFSKKHDMLPYQYFLEFTAD